MVQSPFHSEGGNEVNYGRKGEINHFVNNLDMQPRLSIITINNGDITNIGLVKLTDGLVGGEGRGGLGQDGHVGVGLGEENVH